MPSKSIGVGSENQEGKVSNMPPHFTSVPVVNIELNENMEFTCCPSSAQRTSCVGRHRFSGLQISSHTLFGDPGSRKEIDSRKEHVLSGRRPVLIHRLLEVGDSCSAAWICSAPVVASC
jgi:hypothetical protein